METVGGDDGFSCDIEITQAECLARQVMEVRPSAPVRVSRKARKPGQNFGMAAHWYRQAADQDVPEAQCSLGMLYLRGQGVPMDLECARSWFQKAAAHGHETALKQLSIMTRWDEEEEVQQKLARDAEEALLAEMDGGSTGGLSSKKGKKKKQKEKNSSKAGRTAAASDAACAVAVAASTGATPEVKQSAASKLAALSESDIETLFDPSKFVDDDDQDYVVAFNSRLQL